MESLQHLDIDYSSVNTDLTWAEESFWSAVSDILWAEEGIM